MNGVINVYKEKGYTSFDVVAKLRGILKTRKIGHTGTLDPDAEGVLPVCVGNATKLCEFLTDKTKIYETVLLLGKVTDTQDISGNVLKEQAVYVSHEELTRTIETFIGDYDQIPPMYSAIKVNGKKLYEFAREGIVIERAARKVVIYSIEILSMEMVNNIVQEVSLRVSCSKGTYIRTLCHDIGEQLSCGGCMKQLKRVQTGNFKIKNSKKLDEISSIMEAGRIDEILLPVDSMFHYRRLIVREEFSKLLRNGNRLKHSEVDDLDINPNKLGHLEQFRVYDYDNTFAGVYLFLADQGILQPVKMFISNGS